MKITYKQILASRQALGRLMDEKLPPKAAYNIAKMIKFVNEVVANDIELYRIQVLKSLGIAADAETVSNEDDAKIVEEMNTFLDGTIEVSVGKLSVADLGTNSSIKPGEILALDYLID